MKTYDQFRRELMTKFDEGLLNGPVSFGKIEDLAAKEYAKQWVDRAAKVALIDEEIRTFDGVIVRAESHKEYKFNSAKFKYTITVDSDSILNINNEIDAQ